MNNITKTEFIEFLSCPDCLWVKKNAPKEFTKKPLSGYQRYIQKEGYRVEKESKKLFPSGINISSNLEKAYEETKKYLKEKKTMFQASFKTNDGFIARIDTLHYNEELDGWEIYEVKSSTNPDKRKGGVSIYKEDLAFQTILLKKLGINVVKSSLILLNKEYKKMGNVKPEELFKIVDLTKEIEEMSADTDQAMTRSIKYLNQDKKPEKCNCLYKSVGNRCDHFDKFYPDFPEFSVCNILQGNKLKKCIDMDIYEVKDIPYYIKLSDIQTLKVEANVMNKPIVNNESIGYFLDEIKYPIYFLDYETSPRAIPVLDNYRPYQDIVFQYSLHILDENGKISHKEYISESIDGTKDLLKQLQNDIDEDNGSVLVWYDVFEKGKNLEMSELYDEYKEFLCNLNDRIIDLMIPFMYDYVHPKFNGSASIKKVLPAIIEDLSYSPLNISDGTMAIIGWENMLKETGDMRDKTRNDLLKYCELDTLAMVKLYEFLKKNVK